MTDLDVIERLRAIALRLTEREDADAAWFASRLAEFEAGARHGVTLGDAFGFRSGGHPFWQIEAATKRNELLRAIAARHFPRRRGRGAAHAIATAVEFYQAGRWPRDRTYVTVPAGREPLTADLFALLKLDAPLSEATIRRALDHGQGTPVSHAAMAVRHAPPDDTPNLEGGTPRVSTGAEDETIEGSLADRTATARG